MLIGLDEKGSGPAAGVATVLLSFGPNRSGSGRPVPSLNGSAEAANGSSDEKPVLDCLKKESAAKGSEPLNGSPPNGSDCRGKQEGLNVWLEF